MGNHVVPCPIRDHYDFAHRAIQKFEAKPMDQEAGHASHDALYRDGLIESGKNGGSARPDLGAGDLFRQTQLQGVRNKTR